MAVKRRVIWLDDEAWDIAERRGKPLGMTRSRYISALVHAGIYTMEEGLTFTTMSDVERLSYGDEHFNTRPFTPVPKKGK